MESLNKKEVERYKARGYCRKTDGSSCWFLNYKIIPNITSTQTLTSIWHELCVLIFCRRKIEVYRNTSFFTTCFHAIVLWMVEFTGPEIWPSTVTAYYNPEFNGGIPASWYLLKIHWPGEFLKLLWECKPGFMQTCTVHGLIFSLPPGSPELLVSSTIIHVIDLNFKSQLHFQFQQKVKITQRKNLYI